MNRYDVIHLLSSLQIGGAERFVIDLAKVQQATGKKVAILSFSSELDPLVNIAKSEGIDVLFITKKWWNNTLALKSILKMTQVVHCHSEPVLQCILLALPFLREQRFIYTRHGEGSVKQSNFELLHFFAKFFVDEVTFVSEGAKTHFMRQINWKKIPAKVIENGVDTSSFDLKRKPNNNAGILRLGSVGRQITLKAQHHLLEAIHKLSDKNRVDCEVHFVGDGPRRAFLENKAKTDFENVTSHFHGIVLNRDDIFANIDVLVVNSEIEGLSIAMIEAMAYGIPVIATNVGGNPRLVLPNKTGWLYQYADIDTLSEILNEILNERHTIENYGMAAQHHIRNNFSINKAAEMYNQLYKL